MIGLQRRMLDDAGAGAGGADPGTGGGTVDQGKIVDDYYSQPVSMTDSEGNPVDLDADPSVEPPKKEPKPVPAAKADPAKPAPAKADPAKADPAKPAAAAPEKTVFEKDFFNEDGSVNVEKLTSFIPKSTTPAPKPAPAAPAPAAVDPAKPVKEPWEVKMEQRRERLNTIKSNFFGGLDRFAALVTEGKIAVTPELSKAYSQARAELEDQYSRFSEEDNYKAQVEERKAAAENDRTTREFAQLESQAITNQNKIAAMVGGVQNLQQLVKPEVGGRDLSMIFETQNPNALKLQPGQYQEEFSKWFTRFSSNIENLNWFVDLAKTRIVMRNLPAIIQNAKNNKASEVAEVGRVNFRQPKARPSSEPTVEKTGQQVDPSDWLKTGRRAAVEV